MYKVKRNVLLNPGPATTTDTVKFAQIVPDICPREKEFGDIMLKMRNELVKIVHGDLDKYTSVLFCGSGTINIDACVNSLLPANKKMLVINNGSYSARAAEVCEYYHLPHINLKFPIDEALDLEKVKKALSEEKDIAVVYACHHETGTGLLNPIREIGKIAHEYGCTFIVDTTSTYAMIPIDIEKDNVDFLMASAQKGLMSMTGLSYVVGNRALLEKSKDYPTRSYYTNLYMQYKFFEKKGQMHFTPPVQTVYATNQAIKEYWEEGEATKWTRHSSVWKALHKGLEKLGFKDLIQRDLQSKLVISVKYPNDSKWSFEKIHDYLFERGFTIYPGKVTDTETFRLCSLGAINTSDIEDFFVVLEEGLKEMGVVVPIQY
ncbi:2-aminoethylphosphonate aminotransferase [Crassaminicella profunda]|uniref:2-aminoethylphosphonate aminotransferase n=1 Tax=Crassaminicella profunda TaxID=1286698 RepID=UPI001CA62055|nr:2-aminoethylphosphonate--pyruvate transaminase [Crassaminicella profunda]QZY56090.1 2-aminoethylphosphonate--pyruvate transaminase [Crassaminicella profunda]